MRQVAYIKQDLEHKRGRVISVRERMTDQESDTRVLKNFVYLVEPVNACPDEIPKPKIQITKKIDTLKRQEGFVFKVKGEIYIKNGRFVYKIRYGHTLNIQIVWKTHVLAAEKPAALA